MNGVLILKGLPLYIFKEAILEKEL